MFLVALLSPLVNTLEGNFNYTATPITASQSSSSKKWNGIVDSQCFWGLWPSVVDRCLRVRWVRNLNCLASCLTFFDSYVCVLYKIWLQYMYKWTYKHVLSCDGNENYYNKKRSFSAYVYVYSPVDWLINTFKILLEKRVFEAWIFPIV